MLVENTFPVLIALLWHLSENSVDYRSISLLWGSLFCLTDLQAYLILLCFANNVALSFLYKWKVCGNFMLKKSINTIFPTTFAHFMSLCQILAIPSIFQTFSSLFVMITCDRWSLILPLLLLMEGSNDSEFFLAIQSFYNSLCTF